MFEKLLHICNNYHVVVSSTGTIFYSEVRAFLEKQPHIVNQYKSIATANAELTVTGSHLVYARKNFEDQFKPL